MKKIGVITHSIIRLAHSMHLKPQLLLMNNNNNNNNNNNAQDNVHGAFIVTKSMREIIQLI